MMPLAEHLRFFASSALGRPTTTSVVISPRMAPQKYPLEALRKLRDERAEAQAQELAQQVARSEAAQAVLDERQRVRRAHTERTAESVRVERERLAQGQVSGSDLQRVADFEAAAQVQSLQLERAEGEARQALSIERERERQLRDELGRCEADAKLVRNHEATFHERAAEVALRAEEETALEQWNARRR